MDPATLLGDEVETFDLGATATGTVAGGRRVGRSRQVAEANIAPQVQAGYALVEGSSEIDASPGQVEDGVISFPATITARQVLQIDPAAIEAEIRGKTLADAQAILDGYGRAELSVWPDWVGTIPTLDARVDVPARPTVADAVTGAPRHRPRGAADRRRHRGRPGRRRPPARDPAPRPDHRRRRRGARGAHRAALRSTQLVVGLPLDAAGQEGPQAAATRAWVDAIGRTARRAGSRSRSATSG